ncbi:MAG: hypothetical protein M1816_005071 [Peltula sp. TS41687]|nr:MAG: hypothetical protein M1816_005071 [Peltula sp. TS41687]
MSSSPTLDLSELLQPETPTNVTPLAPPASWRAERRRAQNREAQRKFRMRKKQDELNKKSPQGPMTRARAKRANSQMVPSQPPHDTLSHTSGLLPPSLPPSPPLFGQSPHSISSEFLAPDPETVATESVAPCVVLPTDMPSGSGETLNGFGGQAGVSIDPSFYNSGLLEGSASTLSFPWGPSLFDTDINDAGVVAGLVPNAYGSTQLIQPVIASSPTPPHDYPTDLGFSDGHTKASDPSASNPSLETILRAWVRSQELNVETLKLQVEVRKLDWEMMKART